jgi:hypothetical protein
VPNRAVIRQAIASAKPVGAASGIAQAKPVSGGIGVGKNKALGGGGLGVGGAKPVAAAPTPASAAPAAPPWDATAQAEEAAAQRAYEDSVGSISSQRDFRERYFGLGDGYNDPTANPYSQAALLQDQHEIGERGTMNAAGLQLYAGSTVNRLAGNDSAYAKNLYNLKLQQEEEQARWAQEEQAAQHARESAREEASAGAIQRAAEAEPAPVPVASAGGGGGGGGGGASAGKGKKKVGVGKGKKAK